MRNPSSHGSDVAAKANCIHIARVIHEGNSISFTIVILLLILMLRAPKRHIKGVLKRFLFTVTP